MNKKEWAVRKAQIQAEAAVVVAKGVCPTCGLKLRRNLALTGWYQCSQKGAPSFRANPNAPRCDWEVVAGVWLG